MSDKKRNVKRIAPIDLKEVERLAERGLTQQQIAACLGIGRQTLYNRKKDMEGFAEALARGQAKGLKEITNKLYEQAMDGNTTALIFYLKARGGWADKTEVSIGGNGEPIKHEVSVDELKSMPYEKLIKLAEMADD